MTERTKPKKYKRKPLEKIRDRTRISEMYLRGLHQAEIAHELGVSQMTISRELKILSQDFINSANVNIAEEKGKIKAHLELLIRISHDAWKRSIRVNIVKQKKAQMIGGQVTGQEVSERNEDEVGDPRFLAELRALVKQYTDLFGLDAVKKLDLTTDGKELPPTLIRLGIDPDKL
jgi:transcriptional regulator with XRE-family HTH domain